MKTIICWILLAPICIHAADESFPPIMMHSNVNAGSIYATVNPESGSLRILTVLPNGPAEKVKLKKDDLITHIDGKPLKDLKPEERLLLLRGEKDTDVVLSISRPEPKSEFNVVLRRGSLKDLMELFIEERKRNGTYRVEQSSTLLPPRGEVTSREEKKNEN
jgi:C-terminal processing protease CtpA/Prc